MSTTNQPHSDVGGGNFWLPTPEEDTNLTTAEACFVWLIVSVFCCATAFAFAFFAGWISGQF